MTDDEATLNRSIEYDSVTPTYVRFLIDDLLPSRSRRPECSSRAILPCA